MEKKMDLNTEKIISELKSAISSAKRSILYDINKKMDEVKRIKIINDTTTNTNVSKLKEALGIVLPLKTMEDFMIFENELEGSANKRKALVRVSYHILARGHRI